jgi:cytochrome b involved in lipid metabolism
MKTRNEIILGIMGLVASVAITALSGNAYSTRRAVLDSQRSAGNASTSAMPEVSGTKAVFLTITEVARHSTPQDCFIIVSGKVYSVSGYLDVHPGSAGAITPFCGKDATTAFDTKGGKGSHSSRAEQDLAAFYVGSLGSSVNSDVLKIAPVLPAASGARGDDDDDDEYDD